MCKFCNIFELLKGPKHEIFESGFFTQIRRLWLGDLGTGEKNYFYFYLGKIFAIMYFLRMLSIR